MRVVKYLFILTLTFCSSVVYAKGSVAAPEVFLEELTSKMLHVLRDNTDAIKADPGKSAELVAPILRPSVDFDLAAQYIVGKRYWLQASYAQRAEFIRLFEKLLINTYSTTVLAVMDGTIRYLPTKDYLGKDKIQVNSIVNLPSKKINLVYRLSKNKTGWKIYDVLVERVSLIKGFRSQFAGSIESSNGLDDVIAQLKNKLER